MCWKQFEQVIPAGNGFSFDSHQYYNPNGDLPQYILGKADEDDYTGILFCTKKQKVLLILCTFCSKIALIESFCIMTGKPDMKIECYMEV